jgi:hypothetical protein
MGSRTGLDAVVERKLSFPYRESNTDFTVTESIK